MMGGKKYDDEQPIHEVHVPEFYMGRYPVTNEEYGRFLEANPSMDEPGEWSNRKFNQPRQPVVGVSWHDAKKFAAWAGLALPSEAQWEYACRAGTASEYYTGDKEDDLDRAGWYDKNSGGQTHPVGEKEPNGFGLYDMHGNVWEWCEDHWHDNYKGSPVDGSAWVDKQSGSAARVMRGGSWGVVAVNCRSAFRGRDGPHGRFVSFGFRLSLRPGQ
jgi:formylglycine-generating enzyme required for sulfatase activity